MKKCLFGIGLSAMLATANVSADFISGDMTLRDAIYLYDQDVDARASKVLGGYNCDVFQLVLDATSGFTDLAMFQGNNDTELAASALVYPDRIYDNAAMFSYALYQNKSDKFFRFGDKNNPTSSAQVGEGTIFGYCYSTKPGAYVYFYEEDKCTVKYSDGYVGTIPNCVPSAGSDSTSELDDMSDLVGAYTQSIYISSPGSQCAALGAANGNYAASYNVTKSGNTLTLLGYTGTDSCHFTLNKLSGDSASGYNLSGTAVCGSGFNPDVSVSGLKKMGGKLAGTITASFSGCTQTMTLQ
ncbi:MAG: hypothetical protein LT080_05980 [Thiobacillus sp.]|nr:hypothetical protein [Thiobacillus sp.]